MPSCFRSSMYSPSPLYRPRPSQGPSPPPPSAHGMHQSISQPAACLPSSPAPIGCPSFTRPRQPAAGAPLLTQHFRLTQVLLSSPDCIVHTYAACCVERMLTVKDGANLRVSKADLQPMLQPLLTNLFACLAQVSSPLPPKPCQFLPKAALLPLRSIAAPLILPAPRTCSFTASPHSPPRARSLSGHD